MSKKRIVFFVSFFVYQINYISAAAVVIYKDYKKEDYSIKMHNRRVANRKIADKQLELCNLVRYKSIDKTAKKDSIYFGRLIYSEQKNNYLFISAEDEIVDRLKHYEGNENLEFISILFVLHKVKPDLVDKSGVPLLIGQSYAVTDLLLSHGANPSIQNGLAFKHARSRSVLKRLIEAQTGETDFIQGRSLSYY